MGESINFAIAGTGMISWLHAEEISKIDGAKVVAVFSRKEENAKKLAEKIGADWYTDYSEMLKRDDVDIVNINTPSSVHAEMAIRAAQAGKHVLVEKPIDISLEKAEKMIRVCREKNVKLGIIFQHRFDTSTEKVKSEFDAGTMGQPILGQVSVHWYRPQEYYDASIWRGQWSNGGGVLINQVIHTIDLLIHLMGDVESVNAHMATSAHKNIEVEDVAIANVKFKNGSLATISATTGAYPGLPTRLEIIGTKGSAVIENDQLKKLFVKTSDDNLPPKNLASKNGGQQEVETPVLDGRSHRIQFVDMIDAIKNNREPKINGEEGIKSLKLILAIYQSARTGETVLLDQML